MCVDDLLYARSNPTRHNYHHAHLHASLYQARESVLSLSFKPKLKTFNSYRLLYVGNALNLGIL